MPPMPEFRSILEVHLKEHLFHEPYSDTGMICENYRVGSEIMHIDGNPRRNTSEE